jgi:DNA repair protein RecO (recombination protein O)
VGVYYTIKGLVINVMVYGECDKLITVYSYEWGKVQTLVPSAKKITAKLAFATELLTESEFVVFNNHYSARRSKVIGASIIQNNTGVKVDFNRNLYALYVAEVSNKLSSFNFKNVEKYNLIARVWEILGICKYPKRVLIAFFLRFLKLSGYGYLDYLKYNNSFVSKDVEKSIKELSFCSGDDVDFIKEIEDEKVWKYVESYLMCYIRRSSLSVFFKKMTNYPE